MPRAIGGKIVSSKARCVDGQGSVDSPTPNMFHKSSAKSNISRCFLVLYVRSEWKYIIPRAFLNLYRNPA